MNLLCRRVLSVPFSTPSFVRVQSGFAMAQKRQFNEGRRHFKKNKKQKKNEPATSEGSNEEVLYKDIVQLLHATRVLGAETSQLDVNGENNGDEVELEISEISSTGDGLGQKHGKAYVVPFTVPGDVVIAKVYKLLNGVADEGEEVGASYALTDLVKVIQPSALRTEKPQCRYFTQCSGCQFQHVSYAWQLEHKRRIIEKAYTNFSGLPASVVPKVGATIGSPLQYGYRTKLTPHFDGPPNGRRDKRHGNSVTWPAVPPIGFMLKGTRKTMDIEDCPIGTRVVRLGMKRERDRVSREIGKYQRGATLLLRESTERVIKKSGDNDVTTAASENGVTINDDSEAMEVVEEDRGQYIHRKTCITDSKAVSTEYVDDFRFDNPAGSFFQNNNSILPLVTQYIRDNILGSRSDQTNGDKDRDAQPASEIKNLVDAYCGSGFFTVTLSGLFSNAIGIDISGQSISSATTNARLNNLPHDSTRFIAADAECLFAELMPTTSDKTAKPGATFDPDETVVIIDPPRKGCDEGFIKQLLAFGPARICYVSCNVHTQARDVGMLVGDGDVADGGSSSARYEIESLRGFDFFPQTGHVEGVAMLRKRA